MAARSAAGGRAAAEGPSPPCTQKPSAALPNFVFSLASLLGTAPRPLTPPVLVVPPVV